MERKSKNVDILLVGGGPACCSAAIQLVRSKKNILLITKEIGGLVKNANLIENLLGFPNGIRGKDYASLMQEQLKKIKVPVLIDEVKKVEKVEEHFVITTSNKKFTANYVIIGSGTIPKKLEISGEEKAYQDKKLFYEVYEAKEFLEKKDDVIIIGGGDAAYDYALNISNQVKQIRILQRSENAKCLPLLLKRVKKKENIQIIKNVTPSEISFYSNKLLLTVRKSTNNFLDLLTDKILIAVGRTPNISFIEEGLLTSENLQSTDRRLILIGDIKNKRLRQISIAIGDGLKEAMKIIEENE
ncbi:MAG: NAD(P)/FAD-dependent oxidoreductase [Candidatus Heimdallarchaeum aukensis]|uniref:NAD(P)/FAD-dependent oxidoreductase n=1 Tax=Candidatus Heimdallarchaeum aukensis TaxID=2876573 RepID=A0A9Y1BLS6_9ARCH|nr:MAG: NAD(P)/FAD-dependent oxidoreductase [Candidatus Heimdallarchaeum aukensis]